MDALFQPVLYPKIRFSSGLIRKRMPRATFAIQGICFDNVSRDIIDFAVKILKNIFNYDLKKLVSLKKYV